MRRKDRLNSDRALYLGEGDLLFSDFFSSSESFLTFFFSGFGEDSFSSLSSLLEFSLSYFFFVFSDNFQTVSFVIELK